VTSFAVRLFPVASCVVCAERMTKWGLGLYG